MIPLFNYYRTDKTPYKEFFSSSPNALNLLRSGAVASHVKRTSALLCSTGVDCLGAGFLEGQASGKDIVVLALVLSHDERQILGCNTSKTKLSHYLGHIFIATF
mmetsp:Transcript_4876/g.9167  ORF Transcript_4876/g.9167 Transcript_4876/m.9167 type:complete len:104 (-) Transcript_4876:1275-1586(-)